MVSHQGPLLSEKDSYLLLQAQITQIFSQHVCFEHCIHVNRIVPCSQMDDRDHKPYPGERERERERETFAVDMGACS